MFSGCCLNIKNIVAEITEEFTIHKKAVVSKTAKSLVQTIPSVS